MIQWPERQDPDLDNKLADIYYNMGIFPKETKQKVDPEACSLNLNNIELSWYQKIVSTYLNYGPYRGLIVWHGLGTGKTCTAIDLIDGYLRKIRFETGHDPENPRVFVVLPPSGQGASLFENFKSEILKCPSFLKDYILRKEKEKEWKIDIATKIIKENMHILSYISLANKIQKGEINLNI